MQSTQLSKPTIYTIPDKLRWDGWWLIPPAVPCHAGGHPSEGRDRHPLLSIVNAAVHRDSTAGKP